MEGAEASKGDCEAYIEDIADCPACGVYDSVLTAQVTNLFLWESVSRAEQASSHQCWERRL